MLAANNTPDFRTVSDFRKDHLEALGELFLQVLELCQQAGLVKLGHVALDGTKVRANASKHKAMSYGRMKEKEARLQAEVDELLRKAQEVDEEEDRRYGKDRRGDELPEELAFREGRLRKIREAKAALEAEALADAEQAESEGRNHLGVPDDKAQRNFTDPDSRIIHLRLHVGMGLLTRYTHGLRKVAGTYEKHVHAVHLHHGLQVLDCFYFFQHQADQGVAIRSRSTT